jgi:peptide deformylase
MSVLTIVEYPDPSLKRPARRIRSGEVHNLNRLITDMLDTMHEAPGVGLAAPQVGMPYRMFVAVIGEVEEELEDRVFINPVILDRDGFDVLEEGCLSFPNLYGLVERATWIKVKYQDESFKEHTEEFSGFSARVVQHETDHLDGILLNDRAVELYTVVDSEDTEESNVGEL